MSVAIHPLPQYAFMAWCLVKAQGQLYLFLPFMRFVFVFRALEGLQLRVLSVSLICPINMYNCMKMWYTELYAFPEQGC
jgi:hypothetical protein